MKGFVIIIAVLVAVPAAFAREQSRQQSREQSREQSLLARVTVYWSSGGKGSDRYTRQHKSSTGLRLRSGHCAVDPRHIPYGSRVVFPDGTSLAAVDTGTAVKNRKAARKAGRTAYEKNAVVVDRYFETKRQAMTWANTHPAFIPIRIVSPNYRPTQPQSPARSNVALNTASPPPPNPVATPAPAPTPAKPQVTSNYPALAGSSSIVRNPLNKLGR